MISASLELAASAAPVEVYPLPAGDVASPIYQMTVNGQPVPVVKWSGGFALAHLAIAGNVPVQVSITANVPLKSVDLSPHREKIPVSVQGNRATFLLKKPQYLCLRSAGLPTLFVFVDPMEKSPPRLGDAGVVDARDLGIRPDQGTVLTREINAALAKVSADPARSVLYFPPGLYRSGTIRLPSQVTLYLAAGAVLKASDDAADFDRDHPGGPYERLNFITAYQAKNCGIRGRGVIDGNADRLRPSLAGLPPHFVFGRVGKVDGNRVVNVQFSHVENGFIEGVFSRNSTSWNTVPHYCTDFAIENYKVVSGMVNKNDDGIDPDSCRKLTIRNSFFLARDDGIVLKSCGVFEGQNISPDGTVRDMTDVWVENNVIWCETAALKYGFNESEASEVSRVRFVNNVVIFTREGVQIRTGGPAVFRDSEFIRNWYETFRVTEAGKFQSYNYRLDDPDAHDLKFVNETHDEFAPGGSDVKASRLRFKNLRIAGELRDSAEAARFHLQGTDVQFAITADR